MIKVSPLHILGLTKNMHTRYSVFTSAFYATKEKEAQSLFFYDLVTDVQT